MFKKIIVFLLMVTSINTNAFVLEHKNLKLHINGYLGYKYVTSTAQNTSIKSQPELGLELSLDINDNWSAFTQFTYAESMDNALVYSFLTYEKVITPDSDIRINVGKLRHSYGLYNDVRINPRTRPGVIAPQAIYWDSLRHVLTSGIGININILYKQLEFGYSIDQPIVENPQEEAWIWTTGLLKQTNTKFGSHQLAYLKYSFDNIPLTLKSSWTWLNLGNDNTPLLNYLISGYDGADHVFQFWNNGFIFEKDGWTVSGEMLLLKPFFTEWFVNNSNGFSIRVAKEVSDHTTIYTNYNRYYSSSKKTSSHYTSDINVGTNYHRKNWMVGVEAHFITGGRWVNPTEFFQNPNSYDEWWIIGANFAYFF